MTVAAISSEGTYIYTYHGPQLTSIDVSNAESIGEYAFAYCREAVDVKLSAEIKEIPNYAFAGCAALKNINLENIETIGDYAFMECGLEKVSAPAVEKIGEYAFVSNRLLANAQLGEKTEEIGEGSFSYCDPLAKVENLSCIEKIGDYAFAYTAITEADLTAAVSIGKNAFLKEEVTAFKVTLGEDLEKIGDNPFAMCKVEPFFTMGTIEENGKDVEAPIYTYEISDTVSVIDGSLYCLNGNGLELITYAGINDEDVEIVEDTVRITALAFAGSDVVRVKIPYTVTAIGHKAFYACEKLEMVIFGSYTAPNFEEEFDPAYYTSLENIPGSGDYGTYVDYDGNEVTIDPLDVLPYFMWNVTGEMYSNVFYGANFIDYIGHVEKKITMVKPVNGVCYDSFICDQYFDLRIDGPAAPDATATAAIYAIKAIPERVSLNDKALVEAAREAYTKIATLEQQSLVKNYSDLISAEQRIKALETAEKEKENENDKSDETKEKTSIGKIIIIVAIAVVVAAAGAFVFIYIVYKEKVLAVLAAIKVKMTKKAPIAESKDAPEESEAPEESADEPATNENNENGDNNETEN